MSDHLPAEEAIAVLASIIESPEPLDAEARIGEIDVDSLDLLEWLFELGIEADELFETGSPLESIDALTLGEFYEALLRAVHEAEAVRS